MLGIGGSQYEMAPQLNANLCLAGECGGQGLIAQLLGYNAYIAVNHSDPLGLMLTF